MSTSIMPIYLKDKVTVLEAARLTGRHQETVRRWVREGRVHAEKVGLVWYIDARQLRSLLDGDEGKADSNA